MTETVNRRRPAGPRAGILALSGLLAMLLAGQAAGQEPSVPGAAPSVPAGEVRGEVVPDSEIQAVPGAEPAPGAPGNGEPVPLPEFGNSTDPAQTPRTFEDKQVAVLQGLDKITARTSTFEVKVGETGRFMLMDVSVQACRKTPPIEQPEAAAFLVLEEKRPDEQPEKLFSGWMFASSPALSALEHPVYDVWVIDCRNESTKAASSDAQ